MERIVVLGDTGMLGRVLARYFLKRGAEVTGVSRTAGDFPYAHHVLDVTDFEKLGAFLKMKRADVVINSAALTDIDVCERDHVAARKLNAGLPEALSGWSNLLGFYWIHFSTDQVFDGQNKAAYREEDQTSPVNWYGKTKRLAEEAALRSKRALVLRINIVGFRDTAKPGFAEWVAQALIEQKPITLFDDYVTSSLYTGLLAELIERAAHLRLTGLYHFASHNAVSKYEFGRLLAERMGLSFSAVRRGKLSDGSLEARRPAYLAMNVQKGEGALGVEFPRVEETIDALALGLTKGSLK